MDRLTLYLIPVYIHLSKHIYSQNHKIFKYTIYIILSCIIYR